jgi:hypothetical protein
LPLALLLCSLHQPAPIMSHCETVNANRSTKAPTTHTPDRPTKQKGNIYVMFDLGFYFLDLFIRGHFQEDLQSGVEFASERRRLARLRQELCLLQAGTMFHPAGSGVLQGLSERAANTTTQNMHLKHPICCERASERPAAVAACHTL